MLANHSKGRNIDIDPHRGCGGQGEHPEGRDDGGGDCGELVGYVDDGAYSYAHADPVVLSSVLSTKYKHLEDWMNGNKLVRCESRQNTSER